MNLRFKESLGSEIIYQNEDEQYFIKYDPGYHGSHYVLQPISNEQLIRFKASRELEIQVLREIVTEFGEINLWD